MWRPQVFFLFFFASCGLFVNCAKILGVFPFPSKSHYHMGNFLLKELAKKGHEVTMIASYEDNSLPPNVSYRNVKVEIKKTESGW